MPAAGSCRVCSHHQRDEIDVRLAAGESGRSIALAFGLPRSTVQDHRTRCKAKMPKAGPAPPPRAELELPPVALAEGDPQATLLLELQSVHRTALEAYDRAANVKDNRTISMLVQQLRNNLKAQSDIMAKARKDDRPPAERLAQNPEWAAFNRILLVTLDRYPEAKSALLEALTGVVGEAS